MSSSRTLKSRIVTIVNRSHRNRKGLTADTITQRLDRQYDQPFAESTSIRGRLSELVAAGVLNRTTVNGVSYYTRVTPVTSQATTSYDPF